MIISGIFISSDTGKPVNGATAKLWQSSSFVTPPEKNTALPGSGQVGSSITTGPEHGSDGAYRFSNVAVGSYYISVEYNGNIGYDSVHVGTEDVDLTGTNQSFNTLSAASATVTGAFEAGSIETDEAIFSGSPWVDVKSFGAVGDGTTDDTSAFNNAIISVNSAGGGSVFVPPGEWRLGSTVNLKSNVFLTGAGDATILVADHTDEAIHASGSLGTLLTIGLDIAKGDRTITVASGNGTSWATNDVMWVQSNTLQGEIVVVDSVAGDVVTIDSPFMTNHTIANSAKYGKITPVENSGVQNLRLRNDNYGSPTTDTDALIKTTYSYLFRVKSVVLYENNSPGILVSDSREVSVSSCNIDRLRTDGGLGIRGYGVFVGGASRNVTVTSTTFRHVRHAVTTGDTTVFGPVRGLTVAGCTVSDAEFGALDTHSGSSGVSFVGNTITGCVLEGINTDATDLVIVGNSISGVNRIGIRVEDTSGRVLISGNQIRNVNAGGTTGRGIEVQADNVVITGNLISDCDEDGIRIISPAAEGIVITNNMSINNGGDGIMVATAISGLIVSNNVCRDNGEYGLQLATGVGESCTVAGNQLHDNTIGNFLTPDSNLGRQAWANGDSEAPGHIQRAEHTAGAPLGTGASADYTINWPHSFDNTNYYVFVTSVHANNPQLIEVGLKTRNTASVVIRAKNNSGGDITPSFQVMGVSI